MIFLTPGHSRRAPSRRWTHDLDLHELLSIVRRAFTGRREPKSTQWAALGAARACTNACACAAMLLLIMVGFAGTVGAQEIDVAMDPLLKDAVRDHRKGDFKRAVERYTEYIVKKNPKSAEAFNWRGMARMDLGDLDKAMDDFNQATSQATIQKLNYSDPYNNRGEIFRKKKNYPEAIKAYQKAIELEPSFAEPYYNIALVRRIEGNKNEAVKYYLAFVKKSRVPQDREDALRTIQQLVTETDAPPSPPKPGERPPAPVSTAAGPPKPDQKPPHDATKPPVPASQPPQPAAGQPPKPQPPAQPAKPPAPPEPKFTIFGFDILGFFGFDSAPAPQKPAAGRPQPPPAKEPIPGLGMAPEELIMEMMGPVGVIINVVVYLVFSLFLFLIARKTNTELPWLAFVPIANLYTTVRCAGKAWWWILLLLIPLVNVVIYIIVCLGIAKQRNKSALWGVLLIIPCTSAIAMGYLALSE